MANTNPVVEAQQAKLKELQIQEDKLKGLQSELARLNDKVNNKEKLTAEDTKFISDLGWLSTVSVTIATIAASL